MTERPTSVVTTDQEALTSLLNVHAVPEPRILDVTYNAGRMWHGTDYVVTSNDIDLSVLAAYHDDFRALSHADETFDVLVFDPPHLTDSGNGVLNRGQYGLEGVTGNNINDYFTPFLREAQRILTPNGIVLAKICDQVHQQRYQWQAMAFVQAAEALGMIACDMVLKVRKAGMIDPKWKNVYHVRKVHTYWIVVRKGTKCFKLAA